MVSVKIKKLKSSAVLPAFMSGSAAGADLYAALDTPLVLQPGERALIPTGIAMAIPSGFEGQVRPRSGLALKKGVALVNSPGTIDADYRGEVGVIMINHGQEDVTIRSGERIAQLIIAAVPAAVFEEVDELDSTGRGSGGFGHTG